LTKEDELLAKARDAETHAQKAKDEKLKASWLRIADSYKELAAS
jgi:hypothetical protein